LFCPHAASEEKNEKAGLTNPALLLLTFNVDKRIPNDAGIATLLKIEDFLLILEDVVVFLILKVSKGQYIPLRNSIFIQNRSFL
jgi:hypothetical protein